MRISDWSSDVCSSDLKLAKAATEVRRNAAREALEDYRRAVFPNYEVAINLYLQRFNAGFRIAGVAPVNARAGSSCTYNVVINNQPVAIGAGKPGPGAPSFRSEEHTSELQSLLRISYAVFCLKKNTTEIPRS